MSQKKKGPIKNSPPTRPAYQAPSQRRSSYAAGRQSAEDSRRRMITLGIIGAGVLVAVLVLLMSIEGGTPAPVAATGQQGASVQATESQIAALQQRLTQNPSDVDAMVSLGNTYYDSRRFTEAIPWYEKAVEQIPTNTDVRTDLGTAYFYAGNNEKAKEHWYKALEQDPNKIQAHFNLGVLYNGLTPPDTEAAAQAWETVIRIAPDSPNAKEAIERLKAIGKR